MDAALLESLLFATVRAGTPLLLVALGAVLSERSGVLNLGQEGMMLIGAAFGFVVGVKTGSGVVGLLAAILAGAGAALVFAVIALTLLSNQVATGLALTIFGTGLSALAGANLVGRAVQPLAEWSIPLLSQIPIVGGALFKHDPVVYLSFMLAIGLWWLTTRTRAGLVLRAIGENPDAARAVGFPVLRIRYLTTLGGGALAGLAGGYLSLVYTPMWNEGLTAGRGWIGLALVVFASWRIERAALGAYLFGLASILHLLLQGFGISIPPNLLALLPYVVTIAVLVLLGNRRRFNADGAPRALGATWRPT